MRLAPPLAIASVVLACASRPAAPTSPPLGPPATPVVAPVARPSIVADRGVAYGSQGVRVIAAWRSNIDARGVLVVVPRAGATTEEIAELAHRSLDAGFNHSHVEATEQPLAVQVEVASMVANDKRLGYRQRLEEGRAMSPAITALWLDDRGSGRALDLLRGELPNGVNAAIVVTGEGPPRRRTLLRPSDLALHVLEIAAPAGVLVDDATWAEVLRFLGEVERSVGAPSGGDRGSTP